MRRVENIMIGPEAIPQVVTVSGDVDVERQIADARRAIETSTQMIVEGFAVQHHEELDRLAQERLVREAELTDLITSERDATVELQRKMTELEAAQSSLRDVQAEDEVEMTKFEETLVRIDEKVEQLVKDVAQLKHVLIEGNGTPSIMTQVARMDERLKTIESARLSPADRAKLWAGMIGGAISVIDVVAHLLGH